ncbi:MAG: hypothetical protein V7785_22885 [Bermanella sp.]
MSGNNCRLTGNVYTYKGHSENEKEKMRNREIKNDWKVNKQACDEDPRQMQCRQLFIPRHRVTAL